MKNQIKVENSQIVFRGALISLVFIIILIVGYKFLEVGIAISSPTIDYLMILLLLFPMLVKLPETYNALIIEANELIFKRVLWKSKTVLWKNILSIERKEYASTKNGIRLMVNYFDGKVKRIELLLKSEADFEILQSASLKNKKTISISEF